MEHVAEYLADIGRKDYPRDPVCIVLHASTQAVSAIIRNVHDEALQHETEVSGASKRALQMEGVQEQIAGKPPDRDQAVRGHAAEETATQGSPFPNSSPGCHVLAVSLHVQF